MTKSLIHMIHNSFSSSSSGEWSYMSFNAWHPKAALSTDVFIFHGLFSDSDLCVFFVDISEFIYATYQQGNRMVSQFYKLGTEALKLKPKLPYINSFLEANFRD